MNRIARIAVVAVATVIVAEGAVRAIAPALPETTTWREPLLAAKVRQMEALGAADVVFAGSSQMLFAGDPSMLRHDLGVSWSAYNAGLWGAPPVVNEHWLLEVVVPRLRPKTVVLGVSPVDFVEADTDAAVRNYFDAVAVRDDWLGRLDRSVGARSALVRHRKTLRSPKAVVDALTRRLDDEPGPALGTAGIDAFGRLGRRDGASFRGDAAARRLVAGLAARGWVVSTDQRDAFRSIVGTLHRRGIEVLVADMAVSEPLIGLLGRRGYADYRAFLRTEGADLGAVVMDMSSGVTDTRFFIDYDHVSRAGADVFNTVLARALRPGDAGGFRTALPPDAATKSLANVYASDVLERESPGAPRPGVGSPAPVPPAAPALPVPSPTPPVVPAVPTPVVEPPLPVEVGP